MNEEMRRMNVVVGSVLEGDDCKVKVVGGYDVVFGGFFSGVGVFVFFVFIFGGVFIVILWC